MCTSDYSIKNMCNSELKTTKVNSWRAVRSLTDTYTQTHPPAHPPPPHLHMFEHAVQDWPCGAVIGNADLVKPVVYHYPGCCMPHTAVPGDQGCLGKLHISICPSTHFEKLTAYIAECWVTVVYATKAADATTAIAICIAATFTEQYQCCYKHRHRVHT